MFAKLIVGMIVAISATGAGIYFSSALTQEATANPAAYTGCCGTGAECCFPGSPCCDPSIVDCCTEGSACCFPGSPCCADLAISSKVQAPVAKKATCCSAKEVCCEIGAECCEVAK